MPPTELPKHPGRPRVQVLLFLVLLSLGCSDPAVHIQSTVAKKSPVTLSLVQLTGTGWGTPMLGFDDVGPAGPDQGLVEIVANSDDAYWASSLEGPTAVDWETLTANLRTFSQNVGHQRLTVFFRPDVTSDHLFAVIAEVYGSTRLVDRTVIIETEVWHGDGWITPGP